MRRNELTLALRCATQWAFRWRTAPCPRATILRSQLLKRVDLIRGDHATHPAVAQIRVLQIKLWVVSASETSREIARGSIPLHAVRAIRGRRKSFLRAAWQNQFIGLCLVGEPTIQRQIKRR